MTFGRVLDFVLGHLWRIFLVVLLTLLCGCSVLQTPERLNELAAELRATTAKINSTLDDPEKFVSDATKGVISGGLEKLEEQFTQHAEELDELQEIERKTIAGALGHMGIPGGDAIGLGLLWWLRNMTRRKDGDKFVEEAVAKSKSKTGRAKA